MNHFQGQNAKLVFAIIKNDVNHLRMISNINDDHKLNLSSFIQLF